MKHIFVINPCAGGEDHVSMVTDRLKALDIEAAVYVTREAKDATRYVDEYCRQHAGEALRFYACGGDGTLNEVVSGTMGHSNAEVGCYPCGSGNDYVKYWKEADFHDLKALTGASSREVDVMKVCYQTDDGQTAVRYALNTLNFGFEAEVCRVMDEMRRKPLLGGKMAYPSGILKSLFSGRHNPCRITVDGELWQEGDLLLASLANGRYEGGGFLSAPRSMNDDGWIEVTAIRPISIVRFTSMIGYYKKGTYLDQEKLKKVISYRRGKKLVIDSNHHFYIGIDGELIYGRRFEIENLPQVLRFVVPD